MEVVFNESIVYNESTTEVYLSELTPEVARVGLQGPDTPSLVDDDRMIGVIAEVRWRMAGSGDDVMM